MSSSDNSWPNLLRRLRRDYPRIRLAPAERDYWSPENQTVFYNRRARGRRRSWSLLHELAHALLDHRQYQSDFELLKMEAQAWYRAGQLGDQYGIAISDRHVQHCLDTYRDWLHRRSTCPTCGVRSLQRDERHYDCGNCGTRWRVTAQRFNRPYRLKVRNGP